MMLLKDKPFMWSMGALLLLMVLSVPVGEYMNYHWIWVRDIAPAQWYVYRALCDLLVFPILALVGIVAWRIVQYATRELGF